MSRSKPINRIQIIGTIVHRPFEIEPDVLQMSVMLLDDSGVTLSFLVDLKRLPYVLPREGIEVFVEGHFRPITTHGEKKIRLLHEADLIIEIEAGGFSATGPPRPLRRKPYPDRQPSDETEPPNDEPTETRAEDSIH